MADMAPLTRRKQAGLALLVSLGLLGMLLAGVLGIAPVGTPQAAAHALSCGSTTWVVEVGTNKTFADGVTEHSKVLALRDSSSGVYCGEIKGQNIFWEPAGMCQDFFADLYWDGFFLARGSYTPPCGAQGALTQTAPQAGYAGHSAASQAYYGAQSDVLSSGLWLVG